MKNLLFIIFIALFAVSCNRDDQEMIKEPPIPIDQRYISKVISNGEVKFIFDYNPNKTLKKISSPSGQIQIRYEYENGSISRIYSSIESATTVTDFEYSNGKLVAYAQNGTEVGIEYFAANNYYQFQLIQGAVYEIYLNEYHDLTKVVAPTVGNGGMELNLFYESQFGALHNQNPITIQSIIGASDVYFTLIMSYNLGYQPLESLLSQTLVANYENTYDELGGLIGCKVTAQNNGAEPTINQIEYEYIQL